MRANTALLSLAVVILTSIDSAFGAQALLGGEFGASAGGYGIKVDASFGSDTFSNGVISYDISITFGEAEGLGLSAKENVVVGSGSYGDDAGLSASYTGNAKINDNLGLSGTINSDGSVDGSITITKPLPNGKSVDVEFDVTRNADGTYTFKAKPGVGIELGKVEFKNGAITYTFKGVIYDPNAPVNSYGDAAKRGLYDAWTAPGYAVAKTQIYLEKLWDKFFGKEKDKASLSGGTSSSGSGSSGSSSGSGSGSSDQVCKPGDDPDKDADVTASGDSGSGSNGGGTDTSDLVCKPGDDPDPFDEELVTTKRDTPAINAPLNGKAKGNSSVRKTTNGSSRGRGKGNTSSKIW